ncbi:MAG: segregation/condensation protein A [Patescibacteria group bacterium]
MDIKIDKFEGPLGLLLQLIEQEEMDIAEISLAKIADQYVNYIRTTDKISPGEMADFLVVAAKLLFIKSKSLLPYLTLDEDDEVVELEEQLKMYKEFIEATKKIEAMINEKRFMFAREFNKKAMLVSSNIFSPPKNLKVADLEKIFKELIGKIKPREKELEKKHLEKKINIEEKISAIKKLLLGRIKFSFNKMLKNSKSKTETIVSFLALLELIKQHEVMVNQVGIFKEIMIEKNR